LLVRLKTGSENLEPVREAVEQISQQASLAADIIRKYIGFARKHRPVRSRFDVSELLREATQLLDFDLREHQVSVRWNLASPAPPVVADRTEVCQVLVNLIRNACEAMQETSRGEREIRISTRVADTHVEVSISDRGRGIPAEGYKELARPFVTTKADGMGMGLAVSSRIVQAHGGKLWATPNEGPGATFCFTLPLAELQEAPP
jgi:C4-dicarboxylate-specific signal transduction histidine kinase